LKGFQLEVEVEVVIHIFLIALQNTTLATNPWQEAKES
jgi:hypothetical protein